MATRFSFPGQKHRNFLKQWREHLGLTEDQVAERSGLSKASVSRIEAGKTPYTENTLEALSKAYGRTPAELLGRNPDDPGELWALWDRIRAAIK